MSAEDIAARRPWFERLVAGEQERIELFGEFPPRVACFFEADDAVTFDPKAEKNARKHEARAGTLEAYLDWLRGRDDLDDPGSLGAATKEWVQERGLKIPALFQPLRCVLTGQPGGRDLFDCVALLGLEATAARVRAGVARLA